VAGRVAAVVGVARLSLDGRARRGRRERMVEVDARDAGGADEADDVVLPAFADAANRALAKEIEVRGVSRVVGLARAAERERRLTR